MIKTIIVEDSRLARSELKRLLESQDTVEVIAESGESDEAIKLINQLAPDLIFLDIQLPGKNGFELLDALDQQPAVIFTTAFDEYAVRSFEYDALDYLLKPIEPNRLSQAIAKLDDETSVQKTAEIPLDSDSSVFIKDGEQCWMVELTKIIYFESCGNYANVYFENHSPLIHRSLNQLESRLPAELFFRVNRQQIINLKKIKSVQPWFNGKLKLTLSNGVEVDVSRRNTHRFKQFLSL